ncbi:MAG: hypothetical protein C0456_13180 [Hyphomonas sp.]|nr:hypothetical protein [Hyphomonas sp.]
MTFSVDPDFWLFQSGPRQDGLTRAEASEGRGKAFASSLFGVSENPEAPGIDPRAEGDGLMLASLNLARASIVPASGDDSLEQVPPPSEAPLPDTDFPLGQVLTVPPEVVDLKASHPAEAQPADGWTTSMLSQSALLDGNMSAEALFFADTDVPVDAPPAETIPADPPPLALPAAELTAIVTLSEASPEASDARPAMLPERTPPAPEPAAEADTDPLHDTSALPQAAPAIPAAAPLPAPVEIVTPSGTEGAATAHPIQSQSPAALSDVAAPTEASARAAERPAEVMMVTPAATPDTIVSPPPITPPVPATAAPAADTRQSRPVSTEPEMQPTPADGSFVDVIETVAPPAGVSDFAAQPQGGTVGDAASGPPVAPLSTGGFLPGQPAGQIASLPASTPLTPTHAVLIAAPSQLPDIVARATRDGGQDDRITVQLDPPELGRISIDFKFDGQGLQHVTITAETPEAMRQLRQMHFELVQALERNGLSGQDMSFQHQNPQQNEGWGQAAKLAGARPDTPALTGSGLIMAADNTPSRQSASSGRLDIRL